MKSLIISDTHCRHNELQIPNDLDLIIHCGDSTNNYNLVQNNIEFLNFSEWFCNLPIKHKVIIPGNHDAWATKKYNRDLLKHNGVIYLEHEYVEVEGKIIFGSPYTPTFGDWYFMKSRETIHNVWKDLDTKMDILITHGPPKGILDLAYDKRSRLEHCGDSSLLKMIKRLQPNYHCFGHIHNNEDNFNAGIYFNNETIFLNASCITDNRPEKLNHGITLII